MNVMYINVAVGHIRAALRPYLCRVEIGHELYAFFRQHFFHRTRCAEREYAPVYSCCRAFRKVGGYPFDPFRTGLHEEFVQLHFTA